MPENRIRPADVPRIAGEVAAQSARNLAKLRTIGRPELMVDPQVVAYADSAAAAADMDLYLVSADMTTLAVDAARDIPSFTVADLAPSPHGFLVYGRPLPEIVLAPGEQEQDDASFTSATAFILTWATAPDDAVHLQLMGRNEDILWNTPLNPTERALSLRWDTCFVATFDANEVYDLGRLALSSPSGADVLAVVASTWSHMTSPGITVEREYRSTKKPKGRRGQTRLRAVKVIDLCPPKHSPSPADPDKPGRVYTHRWWVEPYWRSQPYGPKLSRRRPVRVPGHIKGPAGAPLLPSRQRVYQWRSAPDTSSA